MVENNSIEKLASAALRGFGRQRFRGEIYDYARGIWLGAGYLIPEGNLCRLCRPKGLQSCRHFEIDTARQLVGPFRALLDPNVRTVMLLKAVQTLGSLVWDLTLHFLIVHSPFMKIKIFIDSAEKVRRYCDDRLMPTLKGNPDIAPLLPTGGKSRFDETKTAIYFANGKSIEVLALNDNNASSLSADFVVIDEGWLHGSDGLMQKAIDRTKQAAASGNIKIFIVGQAGKKDEDQDIIWKRLHKRVRITWACPCCGERQSFGERGPAILRPDDFKAKQQIGDGRLEMGEAAHLPISHLLSAISKIPVAGSYAGLLTPKKHSEVNTPEEIKANAAAAYLECFHCGHQIHDTKAERAQLMASYDQEYREPAPGGGFYTPEAFEVGFWNPDPASVTIPFSSTMHEYTVAKKADDDYKNKVPLQDFYMNRWSTAWDDDLIKVVRARTQEKYDAQSDWPEEWRGHRAFVIDCQYELQHFWGSVWAVSKNGKSRQLWRGLLRSFGDASDKMPVVADHPPTVCAVQKQFGVLDQFVFLDGGYMKEELVEECAKHGHWGTIDGDPTWFCWTILVGSQQKDFAHAVDKNPKVRHPVSDPFYEYPKFKVDYRGAKAKVSVEVIYFSKLQTSQMFARYRDGNGPEALFLAEAESEENKLSWTAQIYASTPHYDLNKATGEAREIWRPDKQTTPHHYFDVGTMFMAVLCNWGLSGHHQFEEPKAVETVKN